jgi:glycosyltransferase involved in cell wall biosynthesis
VINQENLEISLIIPIYNEEVLVKDALLECLKLLSEKFYNYEIIIIDDGSRDKSLQIIEEYFNSNPNIRIEKNHVNLNQGISVQRGLKMAKFKWVTFNGIDFPLSITELSTVLSEAHYNSDIIVFERKKYLGATKWRLLTSNINILLRFILFPRLSSGFNDMNFTQVYRKEIIDLIMPLAKSPAFTTPEMLFRAKLKNLRIVKVKSKFHERKHGTGSLGKLHDILWTIYDMIRFRYLLWVGIEKHGKTK